MNTGQADPRPAAVARDMSAAKQPGHPGARVDGPLFAPDGVRHLVSIGGLSSETVDEAFRLWSTAMQAVQGGDHEAEYLLYYLTVQLASFHHRNRDWRGAGAMFEAALGAFRVPRYREFMLVSLSENVCRRGDLESAERWLASCTAQTGDLAVDAAHRAARARLATARGEYRQVLALLGEEPGVVPIDHWREIYCGVLRANAWERLGAADRAKAQLLQFASAERCVGNARDRSEGRWRMRYLQGKSPRNENAVAPECWHAIARVRDAAPDLDLCPASFAAADAELRHDAPRIESSSGQGCVGIAVLVLGVGFAVAAAWVASNGGWVLSGVPGLVAFVMLLAGLIVTIQAYRKGWVRNHGVPAQATVDGLREHNVTWSDGRSIPRAEVALVVPPAAPGSQPMRATVQLPIQSDAYRRCYPGARVAVRMHPRDPSRVALADE